MFDFFSSPKVGIDIVEVERFKKFSSKEDKFLTNTYSSVELEYCFSYEDPSTHLAGMFAAKEAISKALGTKKFPIMKIEIRHQKDGSPKAFMDGKPLRVSVSITHTGMVACAIALR